MLFPGNKTETTVYKCFIGFGYYEDNLKKVRLVTPYMDHKTNFQESPILEAYDLSRNTSTEIIQGIHCYTNNTYRPDLCLKFTAHKEDYLGGKDSHVVFRKITLQKGQEKKIEDYLTKEYISFLEESHDDDFNETIEDKEYELENINTDIECCQYDIDITLDKIADLKQEINTIKETIKESIQAKKKITAEIKQLNKEKMAAERARAKKLDTIKSDKKHFSY